MATEIRAYPRPITACDAQFNHLLDLRRLAPLELQRLAAMAVDPLSTGDALLRSSPCAAEISALAPTGPGPCSLDVASIVDREEGVTR